jgi:hypothetical protein
LRQVNGLENELAVRQLEFADAGDEVGECALAD